jgi:hypothetical protein
MEMGRETKKFIHIEMHIYSIRYIDVTWHMGGQTGRYIKK